MKYFYYILIYLLIYTPIKLNLIIPTHISMLIFPIAVLNYKKIFKYDFIKKYLILLISIMIIYSILILLSYYKDFYFLKYLCSQILFLISGIYIVFKMKKNKISDEKILNGVIVAVILEGVTCILIKKYSVLFLIFGKIIYVSNLTLEIMTAVNSAKFIGLGSNGFFGGIVAGYGVLISTALYIKTKKRSYILKYILCIISGMLVARTTVISILLSIVFFIFYTIRKKEKKLILDKKLLKIVITILFSIIYAWIILQTLNFKNKYLNWGTEVFKIFSKDKPRSLNSLIILLQNIKLVDIKNIFWGNGKWMYEQNLTLDEISKNQNLLRTDVGYYRILFYLGIIGLALFIFYNLYLYIFIYKNVKENIYKKLVIIFIFYFFILNIKGFVNNNPTIYLFLGIILLKNRSTKT